MGVFKFAEVDSEARIQSWRWIAVFMVLGIAIGGAGSYYAFVQDVNRISERLDSLQLQIAPAAPAPEAKTAGGKVAKRKGY